MGRELLQRILPDPEIDHIKNTVCDIEMQVVNTGELPKRTRFYQSVLDLQLLDKGQTYKRLKPGYIIFICPFDTFGKTGNGGMKYMTLLMRDRENIEKGIEKGKREGEKQMLDLIQKLINDKRSDEISRIKEDKAYRQKLYREYGILSLL